ncbi:cation diffusion facilitator family transporter [Propionicimonas sp.]|uniref:cation diffusion facilitator family transporter n=1 Tax=Propionicimonas sp. TaxID=1955623 RepID=UPI0039E670CA
MSHDHDHAHGLTATGRHRRRLVAVVAITATVFVAEVIGGLLSGSLSLLADAGHMLSDSAGLVIALVAAHLAARPPTKARTFGLQRAEVLAALVNGVLLVAIATSVLIGAILRWQSPPEVDSGLMLWVALAGVAANIAGLLILREGREASLNLRGAYLEVLGDLIGSLAVIAAAIVIAATGFTRADSVAALAIFVLIVPRAVALLREVVNVLLEATPSGIDLDEVRTHLLETPGVAAVHDLHAWTITSGSPVLTAHIVVDAACLADDRTGEVLDTLSECLDDHFDLSHCTLQLEPEAHRQHERPVHD